MRTITHVALLACTAAAATPAFVVSHPQKERAGERLARLERRIDEMKTKGEMTPELDRLKAEYLALRRELAPHASGAGPGNTAAPRVISPPCSGSATINTLWTDPFGGPIPDLSTVSYTLAVTSPTAYLWDLDLTTNITHTWSSDLDITLTSPAGTVTTVSTDNGGWYVDVFNGTSWDDFWTNAECTDFHYRTGITATPLNPEGSFDRFRGENPNGIWTLTITDDAGADIGYLTSWSLGVTTIPAPPATVAYGFTDSPGLAILDLATVSDTQVVSGIGTDIAAVELYTQITHTWNGDLEIFLTSPAGRTVNVSTGNAGSAADVFNGTTFWEVDPRPVTDVAFVSGVPLTNCSPEGAFANFMGEDPNGAWTLTITDTAGGDVGTLARWDLFITVCGASCAVLDVCDPALPDVTDGCTPDVTWVGTPDVSQCNTLGPSDFVVTFGAMAENKSCNVILGKGAPVTSPWSTESVRCFNSATYTRTGQQDTGDTNGAFACGGSVSLDVEGYLQGGNPIVSPAAAGDDYVVQTWYRDPSSSKTTQMSDAVRFTVCP
jgi:subtilisin-like proprotein convertase family protein